MSGFAGYFGEKIQINENFAARMCAKIAHRGTEEDFFSDGAFAAGARFSAVTPEDPDRLVYNEEKNLVIFFDGRIYNSKQIKSELIGLGHLFSGSSDAEVALHGYEQYKSGLPSRLRGPFAFVIYDLKTRELFGARDHFGVKPLYWYKDEGLFMFASEIKSFLAHPGFKKELNKTALKMYLIFQYSALEETFFKNVFRFLPGCFFTYKEEILETTRYFEIEYKTENNAFKNCAGILEKTLKDSIERHKSGGLEIAGFLSAGVDSSFIVSEAKPQKTFSVGFSADGFDETACAKELSDILKLENRSKIVSADEFFEILPEVQYLCDEPYANLSGVPLYYLARMASAHVKAVFSGEGSDEFFAGYLPYAQSRFSNIYSKLPFGLRKFLARAVKPLPDFKGKKTMIQHGQKVEDYYTGQSFIMDDGEANDILSESYRSEMSYRDVTGPYFERAAKYGDLTKKQYLDMLLWLPNDILLKSDRMNAAHSVEIRTPILDADVFAAASKIPRKYLIKNKVTKWLFRQVAAKSIPPQWSKRKKLGFLVPFRLWLKEPKYRDILKNMFEQDFAGEFFVAEKLLFMLDEHFSGKKNNARKLYTVYSFLVWHRAYFNENQ